MDSNTLAQLLRPEAFSQPCVAAQLRETHISWVVLCGEFAYKLKKPVNFGFLDFSTLPLRRHVCEQELALNRRFAPEIYLAVIEVTDDGSGPRFEGRGAVIDYAVKMRRFDETLLLVTSGAMAAQGVHHFRLGAMDLTRRWFMAAGALGGVFMVLKLSDFAHHASHGAFLVHQTSGTPIVCPPASTCGT